MTIRVVAAHPGRELGWDMHEECLVGKGEGEIWRALGLMSGTSLDGSDVAVIETDGERILRRGFTATYPYSDAFRDKLREGLAEARHLQDRTAGPGRLLLLEQ